MKPTETSKSSTIQVRPVKQKGKSVACAEIAAILVGLCFPALLSELYKQGVFYGVQNSDDIV
jgi:hypothetical protein